MSDRILIEQDRAFMQRFERMERDLAEVRRRAGWTSAPRVLTDDEALPDSTANEYTPLLQMDLEPGSWFVFAYATAHWTVSEVTGTEGVFVDIVSADLGADYTEPTALASSDPRGWQDAFQPEGTTDLIRTPITSVRLSLAVVSTVTLLGTAYALLSGPHDYTWYGRTMIALPL